MEAVEHPGFQRSQRQRLVIALSADEARQLLHEIIKLCDEADEDPSELLGGLMERLHWMVKP